METVTYGAFDQRRRRARHLSLAPRDQPPQCLHARGDEVPVTYQTLTGRLGKYDVIRTGFGFVGRLVQRCGANEREANLHAARPHERAGERLGSIRVGSSAQSYAKRHHPSAQMRTLTSGEEADQRRRRLVRGAAV